MTHNTTVAVKTIMAEQELLLEALAAMTCEVARAGRTSSARTPADAACAAFARARAPRTTASRCSPTTLKSSAS